MLTLRRRSSSSIRRERSAFLNNSRREADPSTGPDKQTVPNGFEVSYIDIR
jgi:hypothetical protein